MTQDEIIRMAREAGFETLDGKLFLVGYDGEFSVELLERFAALVAAHVKSDQIQTAYQQGCEDMKRRMEKRMQQLEGQLQLCQTAVANEREACAKLCDEEAQSWFSGYNEEITSAKMCAAAIRSRCSPPSEKN